MVPTTKRVAGFGQSAHWTVAALMQECPRQPPTAAYAQPRHCCQIGRVSCLGSGFAAMR